MGQLFVDEVSVMVKITVNWLQVIIEERNWWSKNGDHVLETRRRATTTTRTSDNLRDYNEHTTRPLVKPYFSLNTGNLVGLQANMQGTTATKDAKYLTE